MKVKVDLIEETKFTTLSRLTIEGTDFVCFVIEDGHNDVKVKEHTRIWEGSYLLKKRPFGKHYERNNKRFNHEFSIEIEGVKDFTDILFHDGLTYIHTWGCPLLNYDVKILKGEFRGIGKKRSAEAFNDFYQIVAPAMKRGENVWVEINRKKSTQPKEIIKEVVVEKPIEVEKVVYKYPIIDFLKKLFKRKK